MGPRSLDRFLHLHDPRPPRPIRLHDPARPRISFAVGPFLGPICGDVGEDGERAGTEAGGRAGEEGQAEMGVGDGLDCGEVGDVDGGEG